MESCTGRESPCITGANLTHEMPEIDASAGDHFGANTELNHIVIIDQRIRTRAVFENIGEWCIRFQYP